MWLQLNVSLKKIFSVEVVLAFLVLKLNSEKDQLYDGLKWCAVKDLALDW